MGPVGKLIRAKRKAQGVSQVEIGKLLGYSSQFVANWERGVSNPPQTTWKAICLRLKISRKEFRDALGEDLDNKVKDAFGGSK